MLWSDFAKKYFPDAVAYNIRADSIGQPRKKVGRWYGINKTPASRSKAKKVSNNTVSIAK